MSQELILQNDQSGQDKRLAKKFLEQLQRIPEYKMALGDILKDMKRFFKKLTWIMKSIPHTIEDIYEELDAADVQTTFSISKILPNPVVNAGRAGKDELKSQNRDCRNRIIITHCQPISKYYVSSLS